MREIPLRHEVICLEDAIDVRAVNADGDAHYHVLGAFGNTVVDA